MLETLHIRNLALVPELDIEFGPGLNTVTGETGAGKSLVIGAVQLLAGARATPASIRKGEKLCEVAGVIVLDDRYAELRSDIGSRLEAASIPPCEEGRLLIRRVVTESGSRAYVNGAMVTAGFLKELCENLIDLHGPHDNQTLLLPSRQLSLLDTYAGLGHLSLAAKKAYGVLSEIRHSLAAFKAEGLAPEEAGLLEFQLNEIDKADVSPDEEAPLVQKYRLASNSRKIVELAVAAQHALSEDEDSVADRISQQLRALRELEQLDPEEGGKIVADLEGAAESIRDVGERIADYASNLDIDQEEMQRIENRLDTLQRLKRKYGPTLEDVIATADRIRQRLDNIHGRAGKMEELARREEEANKAFGDICRKLTKEREKAAPGLAKDIEEKLHGLGFLKAAFGISLKPAAAGPTGADTVEFAFAANVGEDMQPLRSVASSGEVARVMLAVKTVLSDADSVPILIFDEIDANVGGRVAVSVAEELNAVARKHQVFSITHMPQIAAAGQRHYLVSKEVRDGRTNTSVRRLDGADRLDEIVRMLGADKDSAAAVAHGRELLHL